jgi:hypothetical protein
MGFQDLPLDRYRAMIVRMGDFERSGSKPATTAKKPAVFCGS